MASPIGRLLFQTVQQCSGYTSYHGTQLRKFKISNSFRVKGKLSVEINPISSWLPDPTWLSDDPKRKAAYWAGKKPDSILVELKSERLPIKNFIGRGLFFPDGTVLKITRVWILSNEWKTQEARKVS